MDLSLPGEEIERLLARAPSDFRLYDIPVHQQAVARFGHRVLTNPGDQGVSDLILLALEKRQPFSAVRIGDGEMNLVALLDQDPQNATLDLWAARASIAQQSDKCLDDIEDFRRLGASILESVHSADIVGLLGLWMAKEFTPETLNYQILNMTRGVVGQIKARKWGREIVQTLGPDVTIATAHFYVAVLRNLEPLMQAARRVICMTDRKVVVGRLQRRAPSLEISHVEVGSYGTDAFDVILGKTAERLSAARPGDLYLVGAGPWAEPICALIKAHGAVGVDLGSGFDLLEGNLTRPVHRTLARMALGDRFGTEDP